MIKKIDILVGKYHELFNKLTTIQNKSNSLNREIKKKLRKFKK